eukprot:g14292.t1
MTFHTKLQRAGRVAAGAADVFPDMQAAQELVQKKGSLATAVAALVLTPWEAARLLSVSSVGGEERDVGLPDLVVSVRDEVAREQRELVTQKKAAVALPTEKLSAKLDGILEPLLSESADAAAIMRAKAENKYGNALYSFTRTLYPGHLFAEAKRNIETLKTKLVELFFKLAERAPQMLVSCPEEDTSGRTCTPEVDATLRVQIEYLVRDFVSAVFFEQAAVVARPELAELSAAFPKKIADVEQRDRSPQLLLELAESAWRRPQAWVGEAVAESLAAIQAAKDAGDQEQYAEKNLILGNQLRELGKAAWLAHMEHAQRRLWKEVGVLLHLATTEKQRYRSVALLARGNAVGSGRGGGRGGKKVPRKLLKGEAAARALGLPVETKRETAPEDVELGGGESEAESEQAAAASDSAARCLEARALWEKLVLDVLNRKVHEEATASHVEMLFPLLGRALMDGGVYVLVGGDGGGDGDGVGHSPLNVPDGELQFAPPKNEDPAKIDADSTGLGINVWRMDGENTRVAVLARLQGPDETQGFSERGDEQMNPRASTSSWLVVKVDDRDFQAAFRRELERTIAAGAFQQTFKSGAHMRATVATQVALRNGFWHVARTEEFETAPMTLFVGGEDLESN